MAEQKEKTNSIIKRKDLIYNCAPVFDASNIQWEYKAKLGTLGRKANKRLILFMESIGFSCEDMTEEGRKRRFIPKKGRDRLVDLSYTLAVGACLCLGYDCVRTGKELVASYRKKSYVRKNNHKGPWAGNNTSLFKGRYYVKAIDLKTNEETDWLNRIKLCKALGGAYTEVSMLFTGVTRCFNGYSASFTFHNHTYWFDFKKDPNQGKEEASA